jgi:putative membrane protein
MTRSLTFLTPLALAAALTACGSRTDASSTNTTDTTVADTSNDLTMAPANDTEMRVQAPSAKEFADTAAKSDAFEIASAKLAQANGDSADVKSFAAKMIAAHTDSTAKIKKAAAAASPAITPDPTLSDKQNAQLADLRKLKGADFDKAYAAGQVMAHQEALGLMKSYGGTGDAPTLKAAANEIAPVVQDHLTMAQALAGK